jgi:hypothetical protein
MQLIARQSNTYSVRARIYKYVNYLMGALILGVQAALLYFTSDENKIANTILIIICMILTGIYMMFKLGSRGIDYRRYAHILTTLYRQGEEAKRTFVKDIELERFADVLNREADQISFEVFKMSYGPGKITTSSNDVNGSISSISSMSTGLREPQGIGGQLMSNPNVNYNPMSDYDLPPNSSHANSSHANSSHANSSHANSRYNTPHNKRFLPNEVVIQIDREDNEDDLDDEEDDDENYEDDEDDEGNED